MVEWLKDAIFYEVYPQSFYDSNGDGIGDIPGITQKLGEIQALGCNALWINPCFVSPFFDAGYDVEDYYQVAPRYGTNQDLVELFEKAHKRGMHVLLDLVPGHTSITHAWFKESMQPKENAYTDRYIWSNGVEKMMKDVDGIASVLRGFWQREGCCGVNCFSSQPALNYGFANITDDSWQQSVDAPGPVATREELKNIMRFWLSLGCDGFRVDMAESLVKNDPDKKATIALWQNIRGFLREEFPEAVMVSEWGKPERALEAGFDMDFYLHFGTTGYMDLFRGEHPYFGGDPDCDLTAFVDIFTRNQRELQGKGLMCIPSGNHDMARIARQLDDDQLRLAYGFIYGFSGAPFIYYGDEIGMRHVEGMDSVEGAYTRTGARTPMQWSAKKANGGFSSAPAEKLYMAMDPAADRPDLESQKADPESLYHWIRKLIELRKEYPCFGNEGYAEFVDTKKGVSPLILMREKEGKHGYVVLNPFDTAVTAKDMGINQMKELIRWGEPVKKTADGALTIAPKSMVWLIEE